MISTRSGFGEGLLELGKRNSDVVALGTDITVSVGMNLFAEAFPKRFISLGIAEQNCAGVAAGLALAGKLPVFSTYGVFAALRTTDQIRISICYNDLKVIIGGAHAGISVGPDGATHQALEDIALMRALPNMNVIVPADATETTSVINAIADITGPVYVRCGRSKVPYVMPDDYEFKLGKAYVFHMGKDVNIIAAGIMVDAARKAAEILSKDGIDAGVINMATIKPLDEETLLAAAQNAKLIVTAEEHSIIGGLGGAVCEFLSEHCPIQIKRIGVNDSFGCSGPSSELLKLHKLTAEDIVETVKSSLNK